MCSQHINEPIHKLENCLNLLLTDIDPADDPSFGNSDYSFLKFLLRDIFDGSLTFEIHAFCKFYKTLCNNSAFIKYFYAFILKCFEYCTMCKKTTEICYMLEKKLKKVKL